MKNEQQLKQDICILEEYLRNQQEFNYEGLIEILSTKTHYKSLQFYAFNTNQLYLIVDPFNNKIELEIVEIEKIDNQNLDLIKKQQMKILCYFQIQNYTFHRQFRFNFELQQSENVSIQQQKNKHKIQQSLQLVQKLKIYLQKQELILNTEYFTYNQQINQQFCQQIDQLRQFLNSFQREYSKDYKFTFGKVLSKFTQLQSLYLNMYGWVNKVDIDLLSSQIKKLKNISEFRLKVSYQNIPTSSMARLISSLQNLNSITILQFDFSNCRKVSSKILSDIAHLICKQPQLQYFDININFHFEYQYEIHQIFCERHSLIYSLRNCKDLKALHINFSNCWKQYNSELKYLEQTLSECSQIQDLSFIIDTHIDDKIYLQSIIKGIKTLYNLTKLKIWVFDQKVDQLIDWISTLPKLKKVKLIYPQFSIRYLGYPFNLNGLIKKYHKNKMSIKLNGNLDILFQSIFFDREIENIEYLKLRIHDHEFEQQKAKEYINKFKNLKRLEFYYSTHKYIFGLDEFDFIECQNLRYAKLGLFLRKENKLDVNQLNQIKRKNKQLVTLERIQEPQYF